MSLYSRPSNNLSQNDYDYEYLSDQSNNENNIAPYENIQDSESTISSSPPQQSSILRSLYIALVSVVYTIKHFFYTFFQRLRVCDKKLIYILLITFIGLLLILMYTLLLTFLPIIPSYSVCTQKVHWANTLTSIIQLGYPAVNMTLHMAIYNPNHFSLQLKSLNVSLYYKNTYIGYAIISPNQHISTYTDSIHDDLLITDGIIDTNINKNNENNTNECDDKNSDKNSSNFNKTSCNERINDDINMYDNILHDDNDINTKNDDYDENFLKEFVDSFFSYIEPIDDYFYYFITIIDTTTPNNIEYTTSIDQYMSLFYPISFFNDITLSPSFVAYEELSPIEYTLIPLSTSTTTSSSPSSSSSSSSLASKSKKSSVVQQQQLIHLPSGSVADIALDATIKPSLQHAAEMLLDYYNDQLLLSLSIEYNTNVYSYLTPKVTYNATYEFINVNVSQADSPNGDGTQNYCLCRN